MRAGAEGPRDTAVALAGGRGGDSSGRGWWTPSPPTHADSRAERGVRVVPPWEDPLSLTLREARGGRAGSRDSHAQDRQWAPRPLPLICYETLDSSLNLSGPSWPLHQRGEKTLPWEEEKLRCEKGLENL